MPTKLSDLRKALLANGYWPLPGLDKRCMTEGWNDPKFPINDAAIEQWDADRDRKTTNVRVTDGLLPIDADINDPILAARFASVVRAVVPEVAFAAPLRYGGGEHKATWFARLAAGEEPFIRHASRKYYKAGGNPSDYHHVEIFGGAMARNGKFSRQFGVYGPHTRAGKGKEEILYSWAEGPDLLDLPLNELPVVTTAQVWAIIDGFEKAVAEVGGWDVVPEREGAGEGGLVFDIDPAVARFDVKGAGWMNYDALSEMVETEGKTYCQATFLPGEVSESFRCAAFRSDKYRCVMVEDFGTGDHHLPITKAPVKLDGEAFRGVVERAQALVDKAKDGSVFRQLELTDFYAYMPGHTYIHIPTRSLWPATSINGRLPKIGMTKPAKWLDVNRPVEQMTWSPGEPQLICDRVMSEGGWTGHRGAKVFNLYRPPASDSWLAGDVSIWRDHLRRIYPDDWQEIELWMAQRAQRPSIKVNHAMVLGGRQGIGKDTILEPLRYAIGPWNFGEVTPVQMMGRFNGFLKSVVLRVNEVRDRGETDRYAFYNHSKIMIAAPPDTLRVDTKNTQEFLIPNVLGMVITLNEKTSLYLSSDDRRHFVAWSELSQTDFTAEYFTAIYDWYYLRGGLAAVAQHLMTLDISGFDVKRPPRKTPVFHEIVRLSQAPEDASMSEALEVLGRPDAVTIEDVARAAINDSEFYRYLRTPANVRKIGHRFEECGYTAVQNPDTKSGLWQVGERRVAVYAQVGLAHGMRIGAARARAERGDKVVKLVPKPDK